MNRILMTILIESRRGRKDLRKESLATNHLSPNIQRNSKLYYDSFDLVNFLISLCLHNSFKFLGFLNLVFQFQALWLLISFFQFLPTVAAMPNLNKTAFPDFTFKVFSEFVFSHFGSWVSLATVLVLLFTMTENPELLSLHAQ